MGAVIGRTAWAGNDFFKQLMFPDLGADPKSVRLGGMVAGRRSPGMCGDRPGGGRRALRGVAVDLPKEELISTASTLPVTISLLSCNGLSRWSSCASGGGPFVRFPLPMVWPGRTSPGLLLHPVGITMMRHYLAMAAMLLLSGTALADENDRLYDFTDAFYRQNGVNPTAITSRRQPVPPLATTDIPLFSYQNHTRDLLTLPAYNDSGSIEYFTVMGELRALSFTNDAEGRKMKQIADASPEYIFPQKGTDPLGLGAFRQSSVLDMRNGYFGNNPLGLWQAIR